MTISIIRLIIVLLLTHAAVVSGQGNFHNLNFESATIVPVAGDPYGRVQFASALPGWRGFTSENIETMALHNNIFLNSSGIAIIDRAFTVPPLQGNYAALLIAGVVLNGAGQPADTTISQTGIVPVDSQAVLFSARLAGGSFSVSANQQVLPLVILEVQDGYTLYAADIHDYAGQSTTLAFTLAAQNPPGGNNFLYLDSISFSPIPEPSAWAIILVGVAGLGWAGYRRKGSSTAKQCALPGAQRV